MQGSYDPDAVVVRSTAGPVGTDGDGGGGGGGAVGGFASSLTAAAAGTAENRLPGSFRVKGLAHPPAEERGATLRAMGIADPLVVSATPADVARERAVLHGSVEARNAMFVVAASVHLDAPTSMASLRRMLAGFAAAPVVPALFVLMGNFTSRSVDATAGDAAAVASYFDGLAALLGSFPEVATRTRFILVPGPRDPGSASGLLPRPPLPAALAGRLLDTALIPSLTLATNPVRIRFLSQELVLFRGEVTTPLLRRSVMPVAPPAPEKSAAEHMIRTVIDQGHLCPLPLSVRPLYWAYDHALRLSPSPDALVVAEDSDPYVRTYNGVTVFCPGNFGSEGSFAVYSPVAGPDGQPAVELSRV